MAGPYVSVATFCEKVMEEKDNVLSLIRMIDRIEVTAEGDQAPHDLPPGSVNTVLVISLKPGEASGRHPLTLQIRKPDGSYLPPQSVDVMFESEDRGVNLVLNSQVEAVEGLYWFEVRLENRLLTKVPLRIIYRRVGGLS